MGMMLGREASEEIICFPGPFFSENIHIHKKLCFKALSGICPNSVDNIKISKYRHFTNFELNREKDPCMKVFKLMKKMAFTKPCLPWI